ncbi:NrdH-redoxin [Candidatus Micrarchaeota archaeon]|nr:NrdH-redoxin [Candidatus Micrarchaeota archaeon]
MAKIIVYGTPWCVWCMKAKQFLESRKIRFQWKDAQEPEIAREAYAKSGQMGIPVIDINGEIILGFDVEKIKSLLKIKE